MGSSPIHQPNNSMLVIAQLAEHVNSSPYRFLPLIFFLRGDSEGYFLLLS
jgi:hypothetical protein